MIKKKKTSGIHGAPPFGLVWRPLALQCEGPGYIPVPSEPGLAPVFIINTPNCSFARS